MPGYKRKRYGGAAAGYFKPYGRFRRSAPALRSRRSITNARLAASSAIRSSVMPKMIRRQFNYVERVTINGGAGGAAGNYLFSCNSLYDPNRSSAGHQPLGFDQLMTMYDHFVVVGAEITATFLSPSETTSLAQQICAIGITDSASDNPTNIETILERGNIKFGMLGNQAGSGSQLTLTHKVDVGRFLGRKSPLSDPQLKGSTSANPAEECFFQLSVASPSTGDPNTLDVLVSIVYTGYLIEPKRPASS